MDVAKMKVTELKKELKLRGLPTDGAKAELVERLQEALISGDKDDSGEDLLNDEADKLLEDEKEDEGVIDETDEKERAPSPPKARKLNRNISAAVSTEEPPAAEKVESKEMTEEELKKLRAQKFGVPEKSDDKLAQRAARFGVAKSEDSATNGKDSDAVKKMRAERFGIVPEKSSENGKDSDALKRRAEKFGIVSDDDEKKKARMDRFRSGGEVAPSLTAEEKKQLLEIEADKKKQRASRFGLVEAPEDQEKKKLRADRFGSSEPVAASVGSSDLEEKKKLRAERFKS